MKKILIRLVFMILLMLGISQKSMAQTFCIKCESCEEEDTEYSADIGEEGGEMNIEEADMMGAEESEFLGEEVGEIASEGVAEAGEIATEVGEVAAEGVAEAGEIASEGATEAIEIGAEVLGELSVVDAIPGVGEAVAVGEIFVAAGFLIYSLIEEHKRKERERRINREHELAHALMGGDYSFPLFPDFSIHAEDLNSQKDKVSYVIYLNKDIDENSVKTYLEKFNRTEHIDQDYRISKMNNRLDYAFSGFDTIKKAHYLGKEIDIPTKYKRTIPKIELFQYTDNPLLHYKYNAEWGHKACQDVSHFYHHADFHTNRYCLTNSLEKNFKGIMEFWLAKKNEDGRFQYLKKIESNHLHTENSGKNIIIRIKNLDIYPYSAKEKLFITFRMKRYEYFLRNKDGKPVFPENWDPTESNTRFVRTINDYTTNKAFTDQGFYPNTKGLVPKKVDDNLLHFRVHDYQPKDTEATIAIKEQRDEEKTINPFPTIYTSKRTQYDNQSIAPAAWGTNHLQVDIPYGKRKQFKDIKYVQINALNRPLKVILSIEEKLKRYAIYLNPKAYYNTSGTINNVIEVSQVINKNGYTMRDGTFKEKATIIRDPGNIRRWSGSNIKSLLLHDVPIHPGDIIDISVYYKDGSLSRDVHAVKVSGGEVERAVYTLKDRATASYLGENGDQVLYRNSSLNQKWVIEYVGSGNYAIMSQKSLKVLGIVDGKVGMYEWDHNQEGLLWAFDFSGGANTVKMINVDQQAYLKQTGFNFKESTEFILEKQGEASNIISSEKEFLLQNQGKKKILGINSLEDAFLTFDKNYFSSLKLEYYGCYQYTLFDKNRGEYLYYDKQNGIRWDSKRKTGWWVDDQGDNIVLTDRLNREDFILGLDSQYGKLAMVTVDKNKSVFSDLNNQFKKLLRYEEDNSDLLAHYAFEGNMNDQSLYQHHGTAYGGLKFVTDKRRGKVGQFDGINDYVDTHFDFNPKDYGGDMTISSWIKMSEEDRSMAIVSTANFAQKKMSIQSGNNRSLSVFWHVNEDNRNIATGAQGFNVNVLDNQWHQITSVLDTNENDGNIKIKHYIDGNLISEESSKRLLSSMAGSTVIGKMIGGGLYGTNYKGLIDDVKIWGKALSDEEISKDYLKESANDMIAHYAFEDDFTDSSGNEHHATKHGDRISIVNDSERGLVASFHGEPPYSHGHSGWTPAREIGYVDTNFDFNPRNYNGDITVSLWIKNKKGLSPNITDVIGASTFKVIKNSNKNEIRLWLKGNPPYLMAAGGVPDEAWHHIAISIDSQEDGKVVRSIYIDGKLVALRNQPFSFTDTIGNTILGNNFEKEDWATYGGYMDDVMFWGRALNDNEILSIYDSTKKDPIVNSRISTRRLLLKTTEDDNSSLSSLIIYPNPSKSDGIFNIKFDLEKTSAVKYNIVNFSGKILQSNSKRFKKGNHIWKIKTAPLTEGMYIIKVVSKEWEESRKILVNK